MSISWRDYPVAGLHDELIGPRGRVREPARRLCQHLRTLDDADLHERRAAAEVAIKEMGITFTVYSEEGGRHRPRLALRHHPAHHPASPSGTGSRPGCKQRVQALNLFIDDLYHDQRIIKDGVFPAAVLAKSANFRPQCVGVDPPLGIWAHICGSDLVRDARRHHLRAGGQPARALRRLLHAGEPPGDQAGLPGAVRALRTAAGRRLPVAALRHPGRAVAAPGGLSAGGGADARASTTRPISSTPTWPSRWAASWWRAATSSSTTTTASTCARSTARSGWT